MIFPLFKYIIKAAVYDKLLWSIVGIAAIVFSLSVFFGASAVIEQDQFSIAFMAYGFRLFGVLALCLFVIGFVRRSFDARDIEYLLSRPIGRIEFVFTHAMAFSFLAVFCAFFLGATLCVISSGNLSAGFFIWWASLAVEFIIMANVAMFFSFVVSSATACTIVVFAFYLLSRLMGEILGILAKGAAGGVMKVLSYAMETISILIPRLDLMAQTKWIVYKTVPEISIAFVLLQAVVFVALIVFATSIDMKRRQF